MEDAHKWKDKWKDLTPGAIEQPMKEQRKM